MEADAPTPTQQDLGFCRKQKRKLAKKLKRKQIRKEIALKEREEEEAKLNDEEEQRRILLQEKEEAELIERQRKEFEDREREWLEKAAKKAQQELEESNKKLLEDQENDDDDDEWEYVEEGPAEIIWQGNEIIVKKTKVKVPKKTGPEDADRPTSNPLPPQNEVYASSYRNTSVSAQQVFESVSQQNPNFGTEQDKAHCPFHIKTGACRFGVRCSRAHFYPDKSCTLLIKNMYNGPGLTLEQDEGLECTDEEIDRGYEEFYEDVHTEFLKFGEIVNFKACKNGSVHLRGNVYVHYKSLESAILAYQTINGRYFAGKQITCEYVGVTKWRVAICGEYMKSRLKTCSRGTSCNFIHCFRNPGGDYEWADWDNPPPRYWVKKMTALFGPSDEVGYDKHQVEESLDNPRHSEKISVKHERCARYHSRRSRSRDTPSISSSSGGEDAGGRRDQRNTPSNRTKHSSSRKMKLSIDQCEHRQEDSYFEDDRCERRNILRDHGRAECSKDTDEYYGYSKANTHRHSREQSHPHSHENSRKKHSCNERVEGKDRASRHGSQREYDDLRRGRIRSHSSRWAHASECRKTDEGEHEKSGNHGYDSTHADYRRRKSQDPSVGPSSSDTINPSERWQTGSSFHDERELSRSPDFEESLPQRHIPHGERSRGRDYGIKSRKKASRPAHSERREDERDSSSDDMPSMENLEHYKGKHRISKNHKEKRKRSNEDEDISSGESKERSEVEQKVISDPLKHKSGHHHRRKHRDKQTFAGS